MKSNKKLRNCEQDKCAFIRLGIGCRACAECNAEPYMIEDKFCTRCWNCEHDMGILRWDDDNDEIEEKQLQVAKMR
jgi:hypothetical protein